MRVAMLTGGGDCPGLNAVMRAVARKGERELRRRAGRLPRRLEGRARGPHRAARRRAAPGHAAPGRHDPRLVAHQPVQDRRRPRAGARPRWPSTASTRSSPSAARTPSAWPTGSPSEGVPVVGVPKTIDNDLSATELTFGFDTAVQICVDAIDRLHTTAESHDRVMVVEVMGRHAGHIAAWAGIAGGATMTLIPEEPFDIEAVCEAIRHRHEQGKRLASIVVVAEGATPKEGTMELAVGRGRRVRPRAPRRHRHAAGRADRGPHRLRDPGHDPRPRAAGRHADRVRPGAGHPVRRGRHRRGARRRLRARWWPCRPARSCGCRWPRPSASSSSSTPSSTTSPRSSSSEPRQARARGRRSRSGWTAPGCSMPSASGTR